MAKDSIFVIQTTWILVGHLLNIKRFAIILQETDDAYKVKNRMTPEEDGVHVMLKAEKLQTPYILLQRIWDKEKILDDWKKGSIVKLPKNGDREDCKQLEKHHAADS